MREFFIAGRRIADDEPPFIIAEIGHNHQGEVEKARALIAAAAWAGADAVKLQKRDNRSLYTTAAYNRPYESENAFGATYGEHREVLELSIDQYSELFQYATSLGLMFLATAFDESSAEALIALGIPALKVASGDIRSLPYLRWLARLGVPLIASTGGAGQEDVDRAVGALTGSQYALLQCTSTYPTPAELMNLSVISSYRARYEDTVIGLSDHYDGIAWGPVAYTLGARIFEKHFTLSHTWKGTDHPFSLEPAGLRAFCRDVHLAAAAMGDGVKRSYQEEESARMKMGKSPAWRNSLRARSRVAMHDLMLCSPGDGLDPALLETLVGRRVIRDVTAGEQVSWADFEVS